MVMFTEVCRVHRGVSVNVHPVPGGRALPDRQSLVVFSLLPATA